MKELVCSLTTLCQGAASVDLRAKNPRAVHRLHIGSAAPPPWGALLVSLRKAVSTKTQQMPRRCLQSKKVSKVASDDRSLCLVIAKIDVFADKSSRSSLAAGLGRCLTGGRLQVLLCLVIPTHLAKSKRVLRRWKIPKQRPRARTHELGV